MDEAATDASCDGLPASYPDGTGAAGLFLMSVDDARNAVRRASAGPDAGRMCRAVAAYVIDPANDVLGTPDSFFNLAVDFGDLGDTYTQLAVCRRALELYPHDTDLIALATAAASGAGRFEEGLALIERAREVPMEYWGERPFLNIVNFYQGYLRACDPRDIPAVLGRALDLARDFQRRRPWDERAYDVEAELLLFAGNVDEAYEVLKRAIFEKVTGPDGLPAQLMAAQCCLTMLSDVLPNSCDYDFVIRVAQRGIRSCAREQALVNVGYFVYREALAMDGLICSEPELRDGYGNPEKVRDALMTYRCAYELNASAKYRDNIRKRYSILCHKSGIFDLPLEGPIEGDEGR